ncbi:MAG TPA: hypothetical protein VFQ25_01945 [Ktedonobacterales bacterium]|nr:hypothetical protein [Ktedonobacterales bacterium]
MERPRGITVASLLALCAGLLDIISGAAQAANVAVIEQPLATTPGLLHGLNGVAGIGGEVALSALTLAVGAASLVFGVGTWLVRPWAWALGAGLQWVVMIEHVILMTLDGVTLLRFAIFTLAVGILLYLHGADVRGAFDAHARSPA